MTEHDENQAPGFRVTRRNQKQGFRVNDVRRTNPADLPQIRQQRLADTRQAILAATQDVQLGVRQALDIRPQVQQFDNSCMLACAISIAKGIKGDQRDQFNFDERIIASEARERGLLAGAGMATEREGTRAVVLGFLNDSLGLTIHPVVDRESPSMGVVLAQLLKMET